VRQATHQGLDLQVAAELIRRCGSADALRELLEEEMERRRCDWSANARPNQHLPLGEWVNWLILAGRGFGKTRTGAETVRHWISAGHRYVNLIGATTDDARDIMIEGESGILACCPRDERPEYKAYQRKLVWPNGAVSLIFTADEPERLRGKQHSKLWADELCAWRYPEAWDQATFGLRLGREPQAVITTTPKPTKLLKEIASDPATVVTKGSTYDNRSNLAKAFFDKVIKKYEGTRLGRQELNAEILDDNPNALWQRAQIDGTRVASVPPHVTIERIVVAIDPAVTSNVNSDLTGIVVAGKGSDSHLYVFADASQVQATPTVWATAAIVQFNTWQADSIVGEVNNGGDLVETAIRAVDDPEKGAKGENVPFKSVRASRGKTKRAEPIAMFWEQGRAHMVGTFPELEDQMCEWDPTIEDDKQPSPDRMDALVWAGHELMEPGTTGLIGHYAKEVEKARGEKKGAPPAETHGPSNLMNALGGH